MKTKDIKLNTNYLYNGKIVQVVKRIKNSYIDKWYNGNKLAQKIRVNKQMTFLLNNDKKVFAKELNRY